MVGSIHHKRESSVLKSVLHVLNQLRKEGRKIWWVKIAGGPRQRRGLPDLAIVLDGHSIWFELKAPGQEATPLQESMLRRIADAGATTAVVTSGEQARKILEGAT